MNKTMARLLIVSVIGVGLLFVGMFHSYLDSQGLLAFEQNGFGEVTVVLTSESDSAASATFDLLGLSLTLLRQLKAQDFSAIEWRQIYAVALVDEKLSASQVQPMLGTYSVEAGAIRFVPSFPLLSGQHYRATLSFGAMIAHVPMLAEIIPTERHQQRVVEEFWLPSSDMAATEVTAIYPTADQLPENLLRFYVYFSAPMREGGVLGHIQLVDLQGQKVEGVFFDSIFELWDPSMRRLTLLFDPGRVKTGLRAHEQLGRALIPGESYVLVIGEGLMDAYGNPLAHSHEKAFTVTEADLTPPDIDNWQIISPSGSTTEPLEIHFPAPLDHGLLAEFVRVQREEGKVVQGEIALDSHETIWRFRPEEPWQAGTYELTVNTRLEDIAGNNLHGLFDIPLEEQLTLLDREMVILPFQVE